MGIKSKMNKAVHRTVVSLSSGVPVSELLSSLGKTVLTMNQKSVQFTPDFVSQQHLLTKNVLVFHLVFIKKIICAA